MTKEKPYMFWADKLVAKLNIDEPHIINDSKTPSGRAHVGALRGVVIHDVMFRVLKERGFDVRYTFGVDDYDPLDELPYGRDEHFRPFLGKPLCEVPPPSGSHASDMADYYINEFFAVFKYLGVDTETYRLRDIYRSGQFDAAIDRILSNADGVREIYRTVSGSVRPSDWLPFQVICENCGRIGTTEVYEYDGKEVSYRCRTDMVSWATGCGYRGKTTPFSGKGKLPWKLEWVAKWATRGITIEGAGKDHTTKGGSRDVAAACLSRIFDKQAPLNIPYEFFLVEGAKMSSSRGIGVAAGDMADFLPPEILRFLMLRTQPNRPINFSPTEASVTKLFNEFDRYRASAFQGATAAGREPAEIYRLSEVATAAEYEVPNIQLLQALVQLPHIDVIEEVRKRSKRALTAIDIEHLQRRMASVRYWLNNYASDSEKLELQATLPQNAASLSMAQRAFLNLLAVRLESADWDEDSLQSLIFAVARITPIAQPDAFIAIYTALFGRELGPRAGALFSYLERAFLVRRFQDLPYDKELFWRETGATVADFEAWIHVQKLHEVYAHFDFIPHSGTNHRDLPGAERRPLGIGAIEFYVRLGDNKIHLKRVLFDLSAAVASDMQSAAESFRRQALDYLKDMEQGLSVPFHSTPTALRDMPLTG